MKKLLLAALTLCLVLSLVQVTFAEDRLKSNGEFRIRAYNVDNADYTSDLKDHQTYYDMRLRVGLVWAAAPGITANLRTDIQDDAKWGLDTGAFGRPSEAKQLNTDRAYLRIEKDMFILQGGQIAQYFGNGGYFSAYGPQDPGFALRLKLPVMVDLNYFKLSEDGSVVDDAGTEEGGSNATQDLDLYAVQAQYKADAFQIGGYYATMVDGTDLERTPNLFGVWGNTMLGPVKLMGSLDLYGGNYGKDAAGDTIDAVGTNLWLRGSMAVTDTVTFGADVYYGMARDKDENQHQMSVYGYGVIGTRFGGMEPMEEAAQWAKDSYDYLGTSDQPFDLYNGCGDVGADIYGSFKATESIDVVAQLGYYTPQDSDLAVVDEDGDKLNSITLFSVGASYTFAPHCRVIGIGFYRSADIENVSTDATTGLIGEVSIGW